MKQANTFGNGSIEEIRKGYVEEAGIYRCSICGEVTEKGIVYPMEGAFFDAERTMRNHIEISHGGTFQAILGMDKKAHGLSEHQVNLLRLLYEGSSDKHIQEELEIGSPSTVRNHRSLLKEKERQAKLFLALMELIKENVQDESPMVKPHKNAKMVDDRYQVLKDESTEILRKYFNQGLNGPLSTFSMKEKNKIIVLRHIATRFQKGEIYTEKQVNEVLKRVHHDFVHLRRYLIEYGFMEREKDGSAYWSTAGSEGTEPSKGEEKMDRKKELIMQYKEQKPEAGVYLIRNKVNNKVGVFSTPNLRSLNGKLGMLEGGSHMNKQLQEEWKAFGRENFAIEVAEVLEYKDESAMSRKDRLKKLEASWIEKLQPFGEKGYHKEK